MSEPISGTAAGVAGFKMLGGAAGAAGIGGALATYTVMTMTKPKSEQEWHVAWIATLVGSFGGGAALIMYLGIQSWAQSFIGLIAMLGLCFTCGLPAWIIVRAFFNYADKRKDADLVEMATEIKEKVL